MPQFSVVIPVYRPHGFAQLRASMASNAHADAEWIVVDDGSGPAYDAAFAGFDDASVCVIRLPENRRQGAARNVGLAEAKGDWIKFLDADDRLDDGHLTALMAAARPGSAIPFAPTRHIFSRGGTIVNDSWRDLGPDSNAQLARLLYAPFLHHCGALFSRELLVRLDGYDESLVTDEDGDLLIRALMAGAHFVAVPAVNYHYVHHQNAGRVSSDAGCAKLAARIRVCDKVEAAYAGRGQEMPQAVRRGLALRLDKIALSYWDEDRASARVAIERARRLCPEYQSQGRWPVRALRALGGPAAVIRAGRMYRRIRGRPAGGTQG